MVALKLVESRMGRDLDASVTGVATVVVMAAYMNAFRNDLRTESARQFAAVGEKFDAIDEWFDAFERKLESELKFSELRSEMRDGFSTMETRFSTVESRLTSLEQRTYDIVTRLPPAPTRRSS